MCRFVQLFIKKKTENFSHHDTHHSRTAQPPNHPTQHTTTQNRTTEPPNHVTPDTPTHHPPEGGRGDRRRRKGAKHHPRGDGGLTPDWKGRRRRPPCRGRRRGERPTGGVECEPPQKGEKAGGEPPLKDDEKGEEGGRKSEPNTQHNIRPNTTTPNPSPFLFFAKLKN